MDIGIARPTAPARTRGVVLVHSAPAAMCPHVEWAIAGVLGVRVSLQWTPQPAAHGLMRTELSWGGDAGSGSQLASALRECRLIRFEVTEEPGEGSDGERYAWTPSLGMFSSAMGRHGDVLITEERLRAALHGEAPLESAIHQLLGTPWDDELEAFRSAGEGAPVRWLHQTG